MIWNVELSSLNVRSGKWPSTLRCSNGGKVNVKFLPKKPARHNINEGLDGGSQKSLIVKIFAP